MPRIPRVCSCVQFTLAVDGCPGLSPFLFLSQSNVAPLAGPHPRRRLIRRDFFLFFFLRLDSHDDAKPQVGWATMAQSHGHAGRKESPPTLRTMTKGHHSRCAWTTTDPMKHKADRGRSTLVSITAQPCDGSRSGSDLAIWALKTRRGKDRVEASERGPAGVAGNFERKPGACIVRARARAKKAVDRTEAGNDGKPVVRMAGSGGDLRFSAFANQLRHGTVLSSRFGDDG